MRVKKICQIKNLIQTTHKHTNPSPHEPIFIHSHKITIDKATYSRYSFPYVQPLDQPISNHLFSNRCLRSFRFFRQKEKNAPCSNAQKPANQDRKPLIAKHIFQAHKNSIIY